MNNQPDKFSLEISKRLFLPLTDVHNLSQDIPYEILPPTEIYTPNHFYGIGHTLKNFVGFPDSYMLKASYTHMYNIPAPNYIIEHDILWDQDYLHPLPTCLVWSAYSKELFEERTKKLVLNIGPPFAYAQNYYDETEIQQEKKRLGRNVLIFPMHSTHHIKSSFDHESMLEKARTLKQRFDSVRFCIYWADYLNGNAQTFINSEFECVTAGHMFDPLFYPRLKALLSVCDHAYANSLGTQAGLAIGMDKPFTLWHDKFSFETNNKTTTVDFTQEQTKELGALYKIMEVFTSDEPVITKMQKKLVNEHWGFSYLKSKKELKEILLLTEYRFSSAIQKKN